MVVNLLYHFYFHLHDYRSNTEPHNRRIRLLVYLLVSDIGSRKGLHSIACYIYKSAILNGSDVEIQSCFNSRRAIHGKH